MREETELVQTDGGLEPAGDGWFVVNAREASWWEHDVFGRACRFEGGTQFPEIGINIRVLQPGQPNCMYHGESGQESFLVLAGECLLLVEGEERPLKAWDFVHLPAWTEHVVVGAGDGPCAILMVGSRRPDEKIRYPVEDVALKHGAGVEQETPDPKEAYAPFERPRRSSYPEGALS